jgi:hypothetical protein
MVYFPFMRHGSCRERLFQQFILAAGTYLPSRCLATIKGIHIQTHKLLWRFVQYLRAIPSLQFKLPCFLVRQGEKQYFGRRTSSCVSRLTCVWTHNAIPWTNLRLFTSCRSMRVGSRDMERCTRSNETQTSIILFYSIKTVYDCVATRLEDRKTLKNKGILHMR